MTVDHEIRVRIPYGPLIIFWWRGLNRLQCHVVSVCGCRFESDLDRKEKEINLINKTYENIETKTLNVYVSIEQLVFEFFQ